MIKPWDDFSQYTILDLVILRQQLKIFPEDKEYLVKCDAEIKIRIKQTGERK